MNLIERITAEMDGDMDNFHPKQSHLLEEAYRNADEAGKELLDTAMICLCGWSMKTLLEQQAAEGNDEENEDEGDDGIEGLGTTDPNVIDITDEVIAELKRQK